MIQDKEKEMDVQSAAQDAAVSEEKNSQVKKDGRKESRKENRKQPENEKKIAELTTRNEELSAKVKETQDNYLRLMADFDNFRRHSAEDKLKLVSSASADVIKGLLPVLDDFERALAMLRSSEEHASAVEGTELIYNKMMAYLKTKGLEVIDAKGKDFDTDRHEAVAQFPVQDEAMKGKVFDVAVTGYTLNGEVIRYAKVVVGI